MSKYVWSLKPYDPKQLAGLHQFSSHPYALVEPPPQLNRSGIAFIPDVDMNTTAPDCTVVQVANCIKAFSTLFAGVAYSTPQQKLFDLYGKVVGCAPTLDAIIQTDGAVYADIIGEVRQSGLQVSDQLLVVPDISVLDNSVAQLAVATDFYGCASIGIRVYTKDEDNLDAGKLLDDDGTDPGDLAGRHMTMTWDYTNLSPTGHWRVNFWGKLIPATTRWLQARVDESWAHIWRNLLAPDKVALYPQMAASSQFTWA